MRNFLLTISLFSFSVIAATPNTVIKEIEMSQNAKCERAYTSTKLCLTNYCRFSISYNCQSSLKNFSVKLKVSETTSYNEAGEKVVLEKVKKVVYP